MALASVLLVGSGFLLKSLHRLMTSDPGFNPPHLLTVRLARSGARLAEGQRESAFWEELFARLRNLPGVVSVAAAFPMPLDPSSRTHPLFIEGQPLPTPGQEPITDFYSVSSDYFRTLGTGLLEGRVFSREDALRSAKVAIINRTLAQRYWPGASPLGKRLRIFPLETPDPWPTVVGVVADIRLHALDERPKPAIYLPTISGTGLILRTEVEPLGLLAGVRILILTRPRVRSTTRARPCCTRTWPRSAAGARWSASRIG